MNDAVVLQPFSLPGVALARVSLKVSGLDRALSFYRDHLGLKEIHREDDTAVLSASGNLPGQVVLQEHARGTPRPHGTTGLFHTAILLPDRSALARLLLRLIRRGWPLQGAAHHGVSEAIYLADPDGNGIEIYADLPREAWQRDNGFIRMVTEPLDIEGLLAQASPSEDRGADPATKVGHIHLQVADLARSERFYHGILGFDVTQRSFPGALFLSAGGYHHHVGLNTWAGRGAPGPPEAALGLSSFALVVPDPATWNLLKARVTSAGIAGADPADGMKGFLLRDPDGIGVEVVPAN